MMRTNEQMSRKGREGDEVMEEWFWLPLIRWQGCMAPTASGSFASLARHLNHWTGDRLWI
jgi:hypothetical protein